MNSSHPDHPPLFCAPARFRPPRKSLRCSPNKTSAALAQELSGEIAKRNLEGITRFHRQRGSQGFHSAAEIIVERARAYGLTDAQILQFPADGKIYYGTQRSRPPWDAEFAELWELVNNQPAIKISSYEAEPVTLAEDSESADVTATLIDVGNGTKESDYAGKERKRTNRLGRRATRRRAGSRRRKIRRRRNRQLRAKPKNRLVRRRRKFNPLGPSRILLPQQNFRLHGFA